MNLAQEMYKIAEDVLREQEVRVYKEVIEMIKINAEEGYFSRSFCLTSGSFGVNNLSVCDYIVDNLKKEGFEVERDNDNGVRLNVSWIKHGKE